MELAHQREFVVKLSELDNMGKLTKDMKGVVSERKRGCLATLSEAGTPNFSPH